MKFIRNRLQLKYTYTKTGREVLEYIYNKTRVFENIIFHYTRRIYLFSSFEIFFL